MYSQTKMKKLTIDIKELQETSKQTELKIDELESKVEISIKPIEPIREN